MKILIEGHSLLPPQTGVGRVTVEILHYLESHPEIEQITVFISVWRLGRFWKSSFEELYKISRLPNVRFYRIPVPYALTLWGWERFNAPSLDTFFHDFDLVHGPAHVLPPTKKPGVITIHDTSLLENPHWYSKEACRFIPQILTGMERARAIITPSHYVKERLVNRFQMDTARVHVVPNPFHGEYHCYTEVEKIAFRERVFGDADPYLVWIGELNPRKNVSLLLHTLKELRQSGYSSLRLVLIGKEGYQSRFFFDEAQRLGFAVKRWDGHPMKNDYDILCTGYIRDDVKVGILAASDIFVFPSHDEGFGYPVLEAMASGIPVVCSNAGSLPEIAGACACRVNPEEGCGGYAVRIDSILSDPKCYECLKQKGLNRAKLFQQQDLSELLSIYSSILSES